MASSYLCWLGMGERGSPCSTTKPRSHEGCEQPAPNLTISLETSWIRGFVVKLLLSQHHKYAVPDDDDRRNPGTAGRALFTRFPCPGGPIRASCDCDAAIRNGKCFGSDRPVATLLAMTVSASPLPTQHAVTKIAASLCPQSDQIRNNLGATTRDRSSSASRRRPPRTPRR